jgi:membrane protein implicated in regulation of membrane protease activity
VDALKCPVCGTESLVTVLSRSPDGGLRQFCNECERRRLWDERRGIREIASGSARLLIYAGILLTLLTLTVDRLSISGRAGFGWWQISGTELGILSLVLGLLAGRGLLGMTGLFLLVLSLGADVLHLGHAPGLGWRKQTALVLASLLLAGGMLWRRALRKGDPSRLSTRTKDRRTNDTALAGRGRGRLSRPDATRSFK